MVMPNNIKRTKLINYTNPIEEKEKETNSTKQNSRVSTDKNTPARGKTNTFAEANRYYQSLTERGKDAFDIGALKLSRPDEANPQNSLAFKRNIRCHYFEELLRVHTARLEGEKTFTIPAETKTDKSHTSARHNPDVTVGMAEVME